MQKSSRTPEYRRAYYLANKDKWKEYNEKAYSERKEALLEYQRNYRAANREKIRKRDKEKRQQRLNQAIERLGGRCNLCGEEYPSCVYDFHHLDPSTKEFTIGENMFVSEERFFNEVDKCVLLCANCHRITHMEVAS